MDILKIRLDGKVNKSKPKSTLKFQKNVKKDSANIKKEEYNKSVVLNVVAIGRNKNEGITNIMYNKIFDDEAENIGVESFHKTELVLECCVEKRKQFKSYKKNMEIKNLKKCESKALKIKNKLDFEKILKSNKKYIDGNFINKLF